MFIKAFIRHALVSIFSLLAIIFCRASTEPREGYHVIITRDEPASRHIPKLRGQESPEKATHCKIMKNGEQIAQADVVHEVRGKFKQTEMAKPFSLIDARNLQIRFQEGDNCFHLSVDLKGDIAIHQLEMADSFSLEVSGSGRITSQTPISLKKDLAISMPRGVFWSGSKAHWHVGGQADLSCEAVAIGGRFESTGDLCIKANSYKQFYGGAQTIEGNRYHATNSNGYPWTCVEYDMVSPKRSLVMSQGNISLTANHVGIYGGILHAKENIIANIDQKFQLLTQCNDHKRCETYKEDTGWIFKNMVTRAIADYFESCDDVAILQAGKDFKLMLQGQPVKIHDIKHYPAFESTGQIVIGQEAHVSSSNKQGVMHNHKPDVDDLRSYGPISLSFAQFIDPTTTILCNDPRFIFTHPSQKESTEEWQPGNELAFFHGTPLSKPPMLLSFSSQVEILSRLLFELGLPALGSEGDFAAQLQELQRVGYLVALINGRGIGKMRKKEPLPWGQSKPRKSLKDQPQETKVELAEEEKQELARLLKRYSHKINGYPSWLKSKMTDVQEGQNLGILTQELIHELPFSFIYYQVQKFNGADCLVPVLHVCAADRDANKRMGSLLAHDVTIDKMHRVVNKGMIRAINRVKIQADTIINKANKVKKYSVRTPLEGGDIIGFDIELEVPQDAVGKAGIKNIGGSIVGKQKVSLYAKQGDITNTVLLGSHTLTWDPGFFGRLFGHQSSSQVVDFYPGRITSEGNIELISEAGTLLNEGSKIFGAKNVHLKAYGDVVFKTLTNKHTTYSGASLQGLSIKQVVKEAMTMEYSEVAAGQNLTVESTNGSVKSYGASFTAIRDALFKAKKNNDLAIVTKTLKGEQKQLGLDLFGLYATSKKHLQDHIVKTEINVGGKVTFESGEDNVLEAVAVYAGQPIHLIAKRNNIIKGAKQRSSSTTDSWSFGITFFGSDALSLLAGEEYRGALWALNDEDPLLASIHQLATSASTADTLASTTIMGIEALRLFNQYKQKEGSTGKFLAKRLGIADAQGSFAPDLYFNIAHDTIQRKQTITVPSHLSGQEVQIESGDDVQVLDGTTLEAEKATIKGQKFYATAAEHTVTVNQQSQSVGITSNGTIDASTQTGTSYTVTHDNAQINADTFILDVENAELEGAQIHGKSTTLNIKDNLIVESVEDTHYSFSSGASAYVGSAAGGAYYAQKETYDHKVSQASGIEGTEHLEVHVGDTLDLTGAYISSDSTNATVKARHLASEDIHEGKETRGFSIGGSFIPNGDDLGLYGMIDGRYASKSKDGITRATISENIDLDILGAAIAELNRNMRMMQETYVEDETVLRLVIPIINPSKFAQNMQRIKELFAEGGDNRDAINQTMKEAAEEQREEIKQQARDAEEKLLNEFLEQKKKQGEPFTSHEAEFAENMASGQPAEKTEELKDLLREDFDQKYPGTEGYAAQEENEDFEEINLDDQAGEYSQGWPVESASSEEAADPVELKDLYDIYEFSTQDGDTAKKIITTDVTQEDSPGLDNLHTIMVNDQQSADALTASEQIYQELEDIFQAQANQEMLYDESASFVRPLVSTVLDFVPIVGNVKSAAELGLGRDYIGGQDIGYGERALRTAAVIFPYVKHLKFVRTILWPVKLLANKTGKKLKNLKGKVSAIGPSLASYALPELRACTAAGELISKASTTRFVTNPAKLIKSARGAADAGREIILGKVKTFEQARNKAFEILDQLGFSGLNSQPHIGGAGLGEGRIVGRKFPGKGRWRLDWAPDKGPHIHVEDFTMGKGAIGNNLVILFEGTEETVNSLYRHLNR